MKHLLLTTIAAVLLVGCSTTQQQEPPTAKAPDISIHEAAYTGNIEAVKQHLAAGTDVDAKSFGLTPLHQAAQFGRKKIIELLIAQGADMNAKDNFGRTPLDCALGGTADLLRKHGGKTAKELQPPSQLLPIPDNLVVLTFDDGNKSDFANVPKVLKKHGFGATFYVTEGLGFLKNPQNYSSPQVQM